MSVQPTLRRREWLLRGGAWFLLLFAMAPNVFYLGHWQAPEPAQAAHSHAEPDVAVESEQSDGHEEHCHAGPAKCGGGESLTGSLWAGEDSRLLVLDAAVREAPSGHAVFTADPPAPRFLQPPRTVV